MEEVGLFSFSFSFRYISDWQTLGTSSVNDDPYTLKLTAKIES